MRTATAAATGWTAPPGRHPLAGRCRRPVPAAVRRPAGFRVLEDRPGPLVLRYPAGAVVVVAGLPGAGKSTLLRRVGPGSSAEVHDPERLRRRTRVPYALVRPLVHARHRRQVRRALAGGGALLVHEPAFRPGGRRWLLRAAARAGRPVHLLVVAASPAEARDGQRVRGRRVSRRRFAAHVRGAAALGADPATWATGPLARAGVVSATVLPRPVAARVAAISFGGPAVVEAAVRAG